MKRFKRAGLLGLSCLAALSAGLTLASCNEEPNVTTTTVEGEQTPTTTPTTDVAGTRFQSANVKFFYGLEENGNKKESMKVYLKDEDGICYVNVKTMINSIAKALEFKGLTANVTDNKVTVSYKHFSGQLEYITIDANTNKVTISSPNFYSFLEEGDQEQEDVDFITTANAYNRHEITFNLSDYDLTVYIVEGEVVLPLSIFNLIYTQELGYDFYYVNGTIYGDYGGLNSYEGKSSNDPTPQVRQLTYNYLRLFLHQYYGLASYKGLDTVAKVDDYLKDFKDDLLSTDIKTFEQAEADIFNQLLDDPHSGTINNSIYDNGDELVQNDGERNTAISAKINENDNKRADAQESIPEDNYLVYTYFTEGLSMMENMVYVIDNTAFIQFDEFMWDFEKEAGATEDALNNGDLFSLMYYGLQAIDEYSSKTKEIKNVVVDLSNNTGGYVNTLYELLSFMTNDPIQHYYEYGVTGSIGSTTVKVDNDLDGDFNDDDAHTQYKWYIETSLVSFSCGNLAPFMAKDNGYATIIGQTSGGGECVVGTGVLPDGTYFQKSDILMKNVSKKAVEGKEYRACEDGVLPDIELTDLYDYTKLIEAINK